MAFATAFLAFDEEASLLLDFDLGLVMGLGFSAAVVGRDSELAVVTVDAAAAVITGLVTDRVGLWLGLGSPTEFPSSWLLASLAVELGEGWATAFLLPSSPAVELPPKGMSPF